MFPYPNSSGTCPNEAKTTWLEQSRQLEDVDPIISLSPNTKHVIKIVSIDKRYSKGSFFLIPVLEYTTDGCLNELYFCLVLFLV